METLEAIQKLAKLDLSRRRFTAASVMALLAGVSVTLSGCGGGGYGGSSAAGGGPTGADGYGPSGNSGQPSPSPSASPAPGGTDHAATISANHGHSAVVTAAEIDAGGAIVLDIQGSATHNHRVAISASDLMTIAAGGRVSHQSSTTESHDHTVTFN
jgi:hypothetical protein